MKISRDKDYAIITGDVVDSSKLPKAKRAELAGLLKKISRETRKAFPGAVPVDVDIFRGDSWQLLVSEPAQCLRIALFFRAGVRAIAERGRGLDTRMAVAVGRVDFVRERVSEGDGEAYRLSGRALEAMSRKQRLLLAVKDDATGGVSVVVRLLDAIVQGWTGRQALAAQGALRGWTQEKIAKDWPEIVSQQAVTKHLDSAQWPAIDAALSYVEYNLQRL